MSIKLLFWGTSEFALPALERLSHASRIEVVGVVTRPDAPVGRHQEIQSSPVATLARELGIPLFQPTKLNEPSLLETLRELAPDIALVAAYGKIIPEVLLSIPSKGTLNLHPSLLPKFRGPSPIQAAVLGGEKQTGVSVMLLDAEMDHGPILEQRIAAILPKESAPALEERLALLAADMIGETISAYAMGTAVPKEQDHAAATYCSLLTRESGKIDWANQTAEEIERMSRAFIPWPGIWSEWTDGARAIRVKFFDAEATERTLPPGGIEENAGRIFVGTREGSVAFGSLQIEGKQRLSAAEALKGFPSFLKGGFSTNQLDSISKER